MMPPGGVALRFNASRISGGGVREGSSELGRTAMKVAHVMTRGVISIVPTDSMNKAARLMRSGDVVRCLLADGLQGR
jgi:CBS domain-containing protein